MMLQFHFQRPDIGGRHGARRKSTYLLRAGATVLIACIVSLFSTFHCFSQAPRDFDHGDSLDFGIQRVILDGTCFFWGGSIAQGEFFRGLKRKESGDAVRFYKGKKIVSEYPDQLRVTLRVTSYRCNSEGAPLDIGTLVLTDGFLSSLKFTADWKAGTHTTPTGNLALLGYHHQQTTGEFASFDAVQYDFTVASKNIPLTDHLVLTVSNGDGKLFVRLSVAP